MTTTNGLPTPFLIHTGGDDYEYQVDNSAKELFETCARAAQYNSVFKRESVAERSAQFRGSIVHSALAIRKRAKNPSFEPDQIKLILDAYADKDFGPDEWRTAEHCVNSIMLYNKQWPIASEPFTVLTDKDQPAVELPFKLLLGRAELNSEVTTHAGTFYVKNVDVYWTGRIDAIIDYGGHLVMEHKTTSVLGPTFWDDFQLGSQPNSYVWAARKLGFPVVGAYIDAIAGRKPTRTGVAHEYQRQRFFYDQAHIDEWERDTFTLITDFLEHLCRGYFPKSPKWCMSKYGKCQYWDVCTQLPDRRMELLQSDLYKPVTWSPLHPLP